MAIEGEGVEQLKELVLTVLTEKERGLMMLLEERDKRLEERSIQQERALSLQAKEYERRLASLNHAHEKAVEVQHTYVTQDKYEDKLQAEQDARTHALARVDEKFEEYIKRYEVRQREVDLLLSAQQGAADEAKRAAEAQGRKASRNIAVMGLALGVLVAIVNWIPTLGVAVFTTSPS